MSGTMIRYYLVGGAVRDLLWGVLPQECDYAFSGGVQAFLQANPSACKVGRRNIQIFLLNGQEFMPLHEGSVAADLLHRDLTINALAVDEEGRLYAHPRALADLRDRVLRAASEYAFEADPVRIFRFARFSAVYPDCSLDSGTLEQARTVAAGKAFAALPAERVSREVLKALHGQKPGRFLEVLDACGAMSPWFEELASAAEIPAGPPAYHRRHVLGHTVDVMNLTAGNPLATWMALCHDLGKTRTDPQHWPHHYGHELLGEQAAASLAGRLGMPNSYKQAGVLAARQHMKAGMYATLRAGTRCDLLMDVHNAHMHASFWRMAEADSGSSLRPQVDVDLQRILAVKLPETWRNRGSASGNHLRELRCQALSVGRDADKTPPK